MDVRAPVVAWLAAAASLTCRAPDEPRRPAPAPAQDAPAPPGPGPIAAARSCGEAGEGPTALPPAVARGLATIGRGTLRAGDTLTFGTVVVSHDPDAWIGTMNSGHRRPALVLRFPRAEAGDGPYGAQAELHPGQSLRMSVTPYHLEGVVATDGASVEVAVTREHCPPSAIVAASSQPMSLWVSTDAIGLHTYDLPARLLQVHLYAQGEAPRLQISQLGYSQTLVPRPGETPRLRVGDRFVAVEEVVPGVGTRFDGTWHADTDAHLHVRVGITPAPDSPPGPTVAPIPCGAASPRRTTLPPELAQIPRPGRRGEIATGQDRTLGPLRLTLREWPVTGRDAPLALRTLEIAVTTPPAQTQVTIAASHAPVQFGRLGRELLQIESRSGASLHLQRFTLACPERHVMPAPTGPINLWLGTLGHQDVVLGDANAPALSLRLYSDPTSATLQIVGGEGLLTRTLTAAVVGQVFTVGAHIVEITDVQASGRTRAQEDRWVTDDPLLALSVQVRVTPVASGT